MDTLLRTTLAFRPRHHLYTGSSSIDTLRYKRGDDGEIILALPGYSKEEISVQLLDGKLTITGTPNESNKYADKFEVDVQVSKDVELDAIEVTLENGILIVTQPKRESKKIDIQVK